MLQPQIWFEKHGGHDGLPLEFIANIDDGTSDHCGVGASMAEALRGAATCWAAYKRSQANIAPMPDSSA